MKVLLLIATALPFITCLQHVQQQNGRGRWHLYHTNLTDPIVIFAINGINNFHNASGDQRPRVGESVIVAAYQIVAGTKYKFLVEVSGGDVNQVCIVKVLSKPWLPEPNQTRILEDPLCFP